MNYIAVMLIENIAFQARLQGNWMMKTWSWKLLAIYSVLFEPILFSVIVNNSIPM